MRALLKFKDYKGRELISALSQGQKEGTHINLVGANDFKGRGADDRVDLCAPFNCVVKAIADADNTVFFQSTDEQVETPSGIYDYCWFMCTHIRDTDRQKLGLKVGKKYKKGEVCYTEGNKGIGSGNHIHIEQGYGTFNGSNLPYYKSKDSFVYKGKRYAQYYSCVSGKELPIRDIFFIPQNIEIAGSNKDSILDYYEMRFDMANLLKTAKEEGYEYKLSVSGEPAGHQYDITKLKYHQDENLMNDWEEVFKINGGLFYEYEGQHFACGLEKSRGVNNQDIGMSAVSKYNNAMAIAFVDDTCWFGSQKWIIENKLNECYGALTGIGVLIGGKPTELGHAEFKEQYNAISGRTLFGEDKDGNYLVYTFQGETGKSGLYGRELANIATKYGFYNCICLDGGGSVGRIVNGVEEAKTDRKIKNAIVLYRRKKQTVDPEKESLKAEIERMNKVIDEKEKALQEAEKQVKTLTAEIQSVLQYIDLITSVLRGDKK